MRRGDPVVVVDPRSPLQGREGEIVDFERDGSCVVWFVMEGTRRGFDPVQIELVGVTAALSTRR